MREERKRREEKKEQGGEKGGMTMEKAEREEIFGKWREEGMKRMGRRRMDEQNLVDGAIERSPSTRLAKMYARDRMASFAKDAEGKDQRSEQEKEKENDAVEEKEAQD